MTENTISELKKFFTEEGQTLSIVEFKAEWDKLSDEEKAWFKAQSLK
jgi:hypothetical protein